ncbi:MAG: AbrB family transcriptional regulator [Thermoprotei archaeon]|nr:MAG: AbrB family transcriptional regulator [Thermoprotei archaeon]
MEYVVSIDERGRVLIPGEVRRRVGLKGRSRVLVRVREDGVIELVPLEKLFSEVSKIFEEKFRGWREEEHEASRILEDLVR